MIGQTISHYKILDKLGEGGMGIVYKAQDLKLDRIVALKFLPPHLNASEQDRARFMQESKAAATLDHPNICTIHSIEKHDDQIFIAMQFIDGQLLRDRIRGLSTKQAIDIGIQVADGLAAAHEKDIVHRDIKPENIMIRKDGIAQIMDFGLAKLKGVSRLTKEGSTVGTAGYMSPEQVQGQDADHRSDIFSLGILLYEMLTGQLPFKGVHETAIAYEIVNVDAPPMAAVKPEITPELDAIVLECLEKDPNERTQSAKQVSIDLRRVKRESSRQRASRIVPAQTFAAPDSSSRLPVSQWKMWSGITVVSVLVGMGLGWILFGSPQLPTGPITRFSVPIWSSDSTKANGVWGFAVSPDGSRIAYALVRDDKIYLRNMNEMGAKAIPGVDGVRGQHVIFSPDGRWIAFSAHGKVVKQSVSGGSPTTICDAGDAWGGSWTDKGEIVFVQRWGSNLLVVSDEAGSVPRPLTSLRTGEGERAHVLPHTLPGGTHALFTIWTGKSFEEALIGIVELATGDHRVLLKGGSDARYVQSGHIVYSRGSTLMAIPFDLSALQTRGEPVPVLEHLRSSGTGGEVDFEVSSNGTAVFVTGGVEFNATSISMMGLSDRKKSVITSDMNFGDPLFSPDGSRLCVTIYGPTFHLGVYHLQQSLLTQMTFSADNWRAAWKRDGSFITYSSNESGVYQVYALPATGGGTGAMLFEQPGNPFPTSWSSDGSALAYVASGDTTGSDIWLYTPGGTPEMKPFLRTQATEESPVISPDGHWIAYVSDAGGSKEVFLQPFPTGAGKWRLSNRGGTKPCWSPDGKKIYFVRAGTIYSAAVNIEYNQTGMSVGTGRPELLYSAPGLEAYDVSPDGRSIVFAERIIREERQTLNVVLNWFTELREKVPVQ